MLDLNSTASATSLQVPAILPARDLPVRLLGTMIQGGRGGIYRYVRELADHLITNRQVDLSVTSLAHEENLLPNVNQTCPSWDTGGVRDCVHTLYGIEAPANGVLHVPSYRRIPFFHNPAKSGALVATVHDLAPLHMPEKFGWMRYQFIKRYVPVTLAAASAL